MSTGNALEVSDAERRIASRIDPDAMTGLAVSSSAGGVVFANASEVMNYAKMMAVANSGVRKHLRGNVGACLAIVTQALEWGMSAFAVANKSYFVNDQIAFESQLVQAVILKRAPIKGRIKFEFTGTGANRVCRAWARLAEDPEETVEYVSPPFASITPKNSPLWKSDPDQQHAYYAGRALCRRHFPDVLLGVYADDEIDPAPRGAEQARDVTPARALDARLDALAARLRQADAESEQDPSRTDGFAGVGQFDPVEDGAQDVDEQGTGQQPSSPTINEDSPDYTAGYEAAMRGQRRNPSAEIKGDAARLAHYEAGHALGVEHAKRED